MSPLLVSQPERDQVKKLDPEIFLLSQSWPVLAHLTMSVISHWPDDWSCLEWKTFVSLWESCWWTQTCSWSPSNSSWWACWCWPYHCWVWRKTLSQEQMFPPSYFSESSLDQGNTTCIDKNNKYRLIELSQNCARAISDFQMIPESFCRKSLDHQPITVHECIIVKSSTI